jgi:hypothetical protein
MIFFYTYYYTEEGKNSSFWSWKVSLSGVIISMNRLLFKDAAEALFIAQILVKEGFAVQWLVDNPTVVMTSLNDQAAFHLIQLYAGERAADWEKAESINIGPRKLTISWIFPRSGVVIDMQATLKIDPKNLSEVRFARYCTKLGYDISDLNFTTAMALADDFSRVPLSQEDIKEELAALFSKKGR